MFYLHPLFNINWSDVVKKVICFYGFYGMILCKKNEIIVTPKSGQGFLYVLFKLGCRAFLLHTIQNAILILSLLLPLNMRCLPPSHAATCKFTAAEPHRLIMQGSIAQDLTLSIVLISSLLIPPDSYFTPSWEVLVFFLFSFASPGM